MKDQRTIPTNEKFKKNIIEGEKEVIMNDIVYMFLQSISNKSEKETHRYVAKSKINVSELTGKGSLLGISRATFYNKLKDLTEAGFVKEDPDYYILPLQERFFLIPHETLSYLLHNGVNEGVFKIFAFLGDRNKIMKGNVVFSENILIENVLGCNKTSTVQHKRVQANLDLLSRLGLIRCISQETAKGNRVYRMTHFDTKIGALDALDWNKALFVK